MKLRRLYLLTLIASLLAAGLGTARAEMAAIRQDLARVPVIEMPAKAAELVVAAKARNRGNVTIEAVEAGLALSPSAGPTLVTAISKAAPEMAPIAAGAAAAAQPQQAIEVAKAAASAAPSRSAKIVDSVCRAVPDQYKQVATAVALITPAAGKEILQAIASVFPELKTGIDTAVASYGGSQPSVAAVLDSVKSPSFNTGSSQIAGSGAASAPATLATGAKGPTVGPPYVPYSSSGPNVTPSTSGTVPRGQRTYASP